MKRLLLGAVLLQLGSICFVVADDEDAVLPPEPAITSNTYSIFVSKVLRPGKGFSAIVSQSSKITDRLVVTATLENTAESLSISATGVFDPGETKPISSDDIIPADYAGGNTFTLTVVGVNPDGDIIFSNSTKDFVVKTKSMSIFVQSDKPLYQPGQTVKFRAIVVDDELKPFAIAPAVSYQITAPDGTIVQQKKNMALVKGIAGDEMQLISQPQFGLWTIKFTANGQEESINIEVKEYTLPKCKVDVAMDVSYITNDDTMIGGVVSADYTFGQPVKGSGKVYAFTQNYGWDGTPWSDSRKATDNIPFTLVGGKYAFSFSKEDIDELLGKYSPNQKTIEVFAEVIDQQSQEICNASTTFDFTTKAYKFEKVMTPETFKPKLDYVAYIKFTHYDGTPLTSDDLLKITPLISVTYNREYDYYKPVLGVAEDAVGEEEGAEEEEEVSLPDDYDIENIQWDETGLAKIMIEAPDNTKLRSISLQPKYKILNGEGEKDEEISDWSWQWEANKFKSALNHFIQVSSADDVLTPDSDAEIKIKSTSEMTGYTIMVSARGMNVITEHVTLTTPSTEATYTFTVTDSMVPKITVVAIQHLDEEINSDSLRMNVDLKLRNDIMISLSETTVDAGTDIEITVTADANTHIALVAIDQSITLLKEGNDITKDLVSSDLNEYDDTASDSGWYPWLRYFGRWSNSGDSSEIFEDAGVLTMSDFTIYDHVDDYIILEDAVFFDGPVMAAGAPVNEVFKTESDGDTTVKKPKVRTEFPETWIWADGIVFEDGNYKQTIKVPDTITSWIVSAFGVSDTNGLGIALNEKLTVFRKFFVSVTTPASIIRNDLVAVLVTLYNYHDQDVDVKLTLTPDTSIYVNTTHIPPLLRVEANDARTLYVGVKGLNVGTAHVIVTALANATSFIAQDSLDKQIKIKPEGVQLIKTSNNFFQREVADEDNVITYPVSFPEETIPDSQFLKLMIYSDVIGNSLENIDQLIRMPYGCGEQNMITFAPNVYVKEYLEKSGTITPQQDNELGRNMIQGFNNQLKYQWDNGAFSAFGQSTSSFGETTKPQGSTWLTAFVEKVFVATQTVDDTIVDFNKLSKALDFIIRTQNEDGVFVENGRVIHQKMQGNVNSDQTMTAYCVIALSERLIDFHGNQTLEVAVGIAIDKAIEYLADEAANINDESDLYSSILIYYALVLNDHSAAGDLLPKLEARAKTIGNKKYWTNVEGGETEDGQNPTSVEMTAYMLLANIRNEVPLAESIPIVTWLLAQMTPTGGFGNTQDTVVGIQALARIANAFGTPDIYVEVQEQDGTEYTYDLTDENAIVVKTFVLPVTVGDIKVTLSGDGPVVVQFAKMYNMLVDDLPSPGVIEFTVEVDGNDVIACGKLTDASSPSGMVVIELELYLGFDVDLDAIMKRNDKYVRRAEMKEGEDAAIVVIYLDELPQEEICIHVGLVKNTIPVGFQENRMVMMYDYYEQAETKQQRTYALAGAQERNMCVFCEACCDVKLAGTGGGAATLEGYINAMALLFAVLMI